MNPILLAERVYVDAVHEVDNTASARGALASAAAVERKFVALQALKLLKAEARQCIRVGCRRPVANGDRCAQHWFPPAAVTR